MCVCVASLGLLVVFVVRDVGFKKTPCLASGSVIASLTDVNTSVLRCSMDWDVTFVIAFVYNWTDCLLCECCFAFA